MGVDLLADLPNVNSSGPLDVSTGRWGRSAERSRGRSAKFEIILTTWCHYQGVPNSANCFKWVLIETIYTSSTISDSFNWRHKLELKFTLKLKIWSLRSKLECWPFHMSTDSRYWGTRRGIGGIRALGLLGGVGGCLGASGGIGEATGVLGLAGTLGTQGPEGI